MKPGLQLAVERGITRIHVKSDRKVLVDEIPSRGPVNAYWGSNALYFFESEIGAI